MRASVSPSVYRSVRLKKNENCKNYWILSKLFLKDHWRDRLQILCSDSPDTEDMQCCSFWLQNWKWPKIIKFWKFRLKVYFFPVGFSKTIHQIISRIPYRNITDIEDMQLRSLNNCHNYQLLITYSLYE